jgi:hypothetical protein
VCRGAIFGNGYEAHGQVFCSAVCSGYSATGQFCDECQFETTDEPAGRMYLVNMMFGTSLYGHRDRCPRCYSVVQRKLLHVFLPIPLARYRVLYLPGTALKNQFVSRRVNGPLGEMVRQGPRPALPRGGSPVAATPPPRWWVGVVGAVAIALWGGYEYRELTALEVSGGRWSSFEPLILLYHLGGKETVLAAIEIFAAAIFFGAIRIYRRQSASAS